MKQMKTEYKSINVTRVGDMIIETLIMIEKYGSIGRTIRPVIRISPQKNAPFYQDIVINDWTGLDSLGDAIHNFSKEFDKL